MEEERNIYDTAVPIDSSGGNLSSLNQLVANIANMPKILKLELYGEELWQDDDGNIHNIQISEPIFTMRDSEGNPKTKIQILPGGREEEVYIPNKKAIDSVLSILKFCGMNRITPLSWNSEVNYQEDLLEIETKLAALLMQNRRAWGIDKKELPILMTQLKTLIQDERSMAINGKTIKALQTIVSRVERHIESERETQKKKRINPYGDD